MLLKNFNKLGDTTFRVGDQILAYSNVIEFLISYKEQLQKINSNEELDRLIKDWAEIEGLYKYKKDAKSDNIKRFSFIFSLLKEKMKIIDNEGFYYYVKPEFLKKLEKEQWIQTIFFEQLYQNYPPFQELMSFIYKKPNLTLSVDEIILTFMLLDTENQENVEGLYTIINALGAKEFIKYFSEEYCWHFLDQENLIDSYFSNFRKPPLHKEEMFKILKTKELYGNRFIQINDPIFQLNIKNSNLDKTLKRLKISLFDFINSYSLLKIIQELVITKNDSLLLKDYKDLFKRWLNGFELVKENLIDNSRIIQKENGLSWKPIIKSDVQYPYSFHEVQFILSQIQEHNFNFKLQDEYLSQVLNSTIAEYFVNLYYAYRLKISPYEFANFSRTKLQPSTLYPSSPAPGKGADMYFKNEDTLYIIETTIHNNESSIKNHEIFPIESHTNINQINLFDEIQKQEIKKEIVNLICPLEHSETMKKIEKRLDIVLQNLKNETSVQDIYCKVLNFKQLN